MGRRISQRTAWWLGGGLIGLLVFGPSLFEMARISLMQRRLDRRLSQLSAEHERLTREQERLQHDPTYVEGLIRSTFKWSQPGELVIPLDAPPSATQRPNRQ